MDKVSKKWTSEEIDFLTKNFSKLNYSEIAPVLGRTVNAVEKKVRKLNLSKRKKDFWSNEEVEYLKSNYLDMEYKQIADVLGRTMAAVNDKALSLGLKKFELYTEEEDAFLLKYYGKATMKKLCKRLGKSERSIKKRMRLLEGTENIYIINGYFKTGDIAAITGVDVGTVSRWIKRDILSAVRPSSFYYVNPPAFWKFIKENMNKCNVKNIDDQILLTCPDWYQNEINKKKRYYHQETQRMRNWTTKEVALLKHYLFKGYNHNEIAMELNRTYHSVHNKVKHLTQQEVR